MQLTEQISRRNFYAFLFHATFLALAQSFMDIDTVIPSMIVDSGGKAFHIGIMTAIMLGGSSLTQLFFAPYLSNKNYKKKFLLLGINLRIASLLALSLMLFYVFYFHSLHSLWLIFFFITIFSVSGSFSNISYNDILGKSVFENRRKSFFSAKQIIAGVMVLFSAFFAKKIITVDDYPLNYAYLFLLGGSLLLIASLGFWNLKEVEPSNLQINGFGDFIGKLKLELKQNKRLTYFLGFVNTQGVLITLLSFVTLYAKSSLNATNALTGTFLLNKTIGLVLISILTYFFAKRIKYRILLYSNLILSIILISAVLIIKDAKLISFLFILGGMIFSLYSISMNGVLLEISDKHNRAVYTGFAGAGNILPAILPIIGGLIIKYVNFHFFFMLYIPLIAAATFFVFKINCKK